jgi:uncharacterized protein
MGLTKKAASNLEKHGVAFSEIERFQWETALVEVDDRRDYGEQRWRALGLIGNRVHVVVFTKRRTVRLISLRKGNRKEVSAYVER